MSESTPAFLRRCADRRVALARQMLDAASSADHPRMAELCRRAALAEMEQAVVLIREAGP